MNAERAIEFYKAGIAEGIRLQKLSQAQEGAVLLFPRGTVEIFVNGVRRYLESGDTLTVSRSMGWTLTSVEHTNGLARDAARS